ncbi:hypothetical protein CDD82_3871 [Ophiocordyceps australis]|uniref:Uncharacterized protein n=1 Tax=Ophiocordyceps australis TaxID=1399860 RepID=A0A2C5XMD6_9HYPO|nr:hypothetical protein CDD82_3871 [Ophiocordyceps australis]
MAPDDAPPPLTIDTLDTQDDRRDAMALVADSIAQQRQVASLAIIFHPFCLASLVAACAFVWRRNSDLGTSLTAVCGLVMAYLAAVRLVTSRFIGLAEDFRWLSFLSAPETDGTPNQDMVIAARFGDELIGTLVLRLIPSSTLHHAADAASQHNMTTKPPACNKTPNYTLEGGSGLIRAWTTKLRYRNRGIGADLLRFAVAATRSVCGPTAPVSFAPDHAHSALPLPAMFSRPFLARNQKAATALQHALADYNNGLSSFEQASALSP